jgi:hypothetical protein
VGLAPRETYSSAAEKDVGVFFPRHPTGDVLVLVEGGERDVRPPHVPDVDAAIYDERARSYVVSPLGAPLDVADRGDGVDRVFQSQLARQVPHLDTKSTKCHSLST